MNRKLIAFLEIVCGVLLLFLSITVFSQPNTDMLSGICIGFGSALFVLGVVTFIRILTVSEEKHKELVREKRIEQKDERNNVILSKSSNITSKIMTYIIIIMIFVLSFIGVDKLIIIGLSSLLILKVVLLIIFSNYYSKKL